MSSFTAADYTNCDQLAADWYHQSIAGGYSSSQATHAHDQVLIMCLENGGSSSTVLNIK